jgi:signal transduction histidine kinase
MPFVNPPLYRAPHRQAASALAALARMQRRNMVDDEQYSPCVRALCWNQKVLITVGRYAMATLHYRTICVPILFLAAPALREARAASPWELPAAAGAGLAWVALLAVGCCLLLRRCLAAEDRLRSVEARLCLEQNARLQAEQALADGHAVLSQLVHRQGSVRDNERGRIARDIHDDLGQTLLALRIDLSLLQVATNGIHPVINEKLGLLAGTLDQALRSMRTLINGLRPLALGEGLRCAMERQVREFSRISGIAHEFAADEHAFEAGQRADAVEVVLYRVLQESLSNVARHSHASLVRVQLGWEEGRLTLRVEDNGVGMASTDPVGYGCGLSGMRERISAAGGDLLIESGPAVGTLLAMSLPVAHETVAR